MLIDKQFKRELRRIRKGWKPPNDLWDCTFPILDLAALRIMDEETWDDQMAAAQSISDRLTDMGYPPGGEGLPLWEMVEDHRPYDMALAAFGVRNGERIPDADSPMSGWMQNCLTNMDGSLDEDFKEHLVASMHDGDFSAVFPYY